MSLNTINSDELMRMFLCGAAKLEASKEWINDLNVFPVPDGDTGTNMSMTLMSAGQALNALEEKDMMSVCKAIAHGSLRGARGNSGVILSQLIRGFMRSIREHEIVDITMLSDALRKAVDTAYKAVMQPKEGTLLTVARGIADKAVKLEHKDITLVEHFKAILEEGDRVLEMTPELLPVLKEAGVVDAGGQGLMVVLHGAYESFTGKSDLTLDLGQTKPVTPAARSVRQEADIKFGYCTEFIINIDAPVGKDRQQMLNEFLMSKGDSIVLVCDDDLIKIHVHTNDPGDVIQKALEFGELVNIKIDNMREEHRNTLGISHDVPEEIITDEEPGQYGFITVATGEGFNDIFRSLNVDIIIDGGQTMNPSTDDFINAINQVNAENIFIYPNNKNIILAAEQAKELTKDKNIIVIKTKTIPQGISALINFEPGNDITENEEAMNEALGIVSTVQITTAVRDSHIDEFDIKEGDLMAIGDAGLLSVGQDITKVCTESVRSLADDDSEVITIYYGNGLTPEKAEEIRCAAEEMFGDKAVELIYGGQAVYDLIISVE